MFCAAFHREIEGRISLLEWDFPLSIFISAHVACIPSLRQPSLSGGELIASLGGVNNYVGAHLDLLASRRVLAFRVLRVARKRDRLHFAV